MAQLQALATLKDATCTVCMASLVCVCVCVLCSRQPINSPVNLIVIPSTGPPNPTRRYGGVGEHYKLPQRGLGRSAAKEGIDFGAF